MKIIEPNVELWRQGDDVIKHVARCARICYKRETGNDEVLIKSLISRKHLSVFRHQSVYAIIPNHDRELRDYPLYYANCPYLQIKIFNGNTYVVTNKQFIIENTDNFIKLINSYQVSENEFSKSEFGFNMMRYTFVIDTQISTSRELNRVSPNNITEQSTRYVYEDGTICRPHWLTKESIKLYEEAPIIDMIDTVYLDSCNDSFKRYKYLVDIGMHRQDARGVLPLDTATRCAYTYSIDEWRAILDLRYYGTTGAPHPNVKIIAGMIRNELINLGYDFRD